MFMADKFSEVPQEARDLVDSAYTHLESLCLSKCRADCCKGSSILVTQIQQTRFLKKISN
jgi:hypothetical protein